MTIIIIEITYVQKKSDNKIPVEDNINSEKFCKLSN